MHKHLKFKHDQSSKVWFTSDFHGKHNKEFVWQSRGFNSVNEHWEFWINKVNELVRPTDILFHLGDLLLNATEADFYELAGRINCQNIYHLWGNHESVPHRIYKNELARQGFSQDIEVYPLKVENFTFVGSYAEVIVNGEFIVLSHYPLSSWNHMNKGSLHLFGHEHGSLKTNNKSFDVGFDNFKKFIDFDEVKKDMNKREYISIGHH